MSAKKASRTASLGLTKRAQRYNTIGILVSLPLVGVSVWALVTRGVNAAEAGDDIRATSMLVSGVVVVSLIILGAVAGVGYFLIRARRTSRTVQLLAERLPNAVIVSVSYAEISGLVRPGLGWDNLPSNLLVCVGQNRLSAVSVRPAAEELASFSFSSISASTGVRNFARTEFTELRIVAISGDEHVELRVFPELRRRFSRPGFGSIDDLVATINLSAG